MNPPEGDSCMLSKAVKLTACFQFCSSPIEEEHWKPFYFLVLSPSLGKNNVTLKTFSNQFQVKLVEVKEIKR